MSEKKGTETAKTETQKPEAATPAPAVDQNVLALIQAVAVTPEKLKIILEESKKPYVSPEELARKERDRIRKRQEAAENTREKEWHIKNCSHMRQNNTSAIGWCEQKIWDAKLGQEITKVFGVCQRCPGVFTPDNPDFARLRTIPTGTQ